MAIQPTSGFTPRTAGKQVTEEDQEAFRSVSVRDRLKNMSIPLPAPAIEASRTPSKTWTRPAPVQTFAPQCPTDLPPPCPVVTQNVATVILPPPPVNLPPPPSLPPRRSNVEKAIETEVPGVLPPPPRVRAPYSPPVRQEDKPKTPVKPILHTNDFLASLKNNRLFQKASAETEGEVSQKAGALGYQYNNELQIFTNKEGDFLTLDDVIRNNSTDKATQQERDLAAATRKLLQELTPEHKLAEKALEDKKAQEEADALFAKQLEESPIVQQPQVDVQSSLFLRIIKAFEDEGFVWQGEALCCTHASGAFADAEQMQKMLVDELSRFIYADNEKDSLETIWDAFPYNDFSQLIRNLIRDAENQ